MPTQVDQVAGLGRGIVRRFRYEVGIGQAIVRGLKAANEIVDLGLRETSEVEVHAFQPLGGDLLQWTHQRRLLVLELKYEREDDDAARWVTQWLPLRISRNSKYVTGMSLVYPHVQL